MQEASGGTKRVERVEWMYSGGSSAGQAGTTEEMELYLLGKTRIDRLLKDKQTKRLETAASEETFMALQHANTLRDTASKIRDDPMLAIKQRSDEAFRAMMNDPIKRRALLKAAGQEDQDEGKERKHRKHRHHHEREHHSDRDRDRHRHRHSDRDDRRSRDHHRRRRSYSTSISPSPSPDRRSRPSRYRSPSPYRRSRSPRRNRHDLKHSKSWHSRDNRDFSEQRNTGDLDRNGGSDREAKLAAMQQAASELDVDREKRLQSIAAREAADLEADNAARARTSKQGGGKGTFLSSMNRRAGELGVSERIQRGRAGYVGDGD